MDSDCYQGKSLSMMMQRRNSGHVLYVKCTKDLKKIFFGFNYPSGNKMGYLKLYMNEILFVQELWNFRKKTSLEGDSIHLVLLLE